MIENDITGAAKKSVETKVTGAAKKSVETIESRLTRLECLMRKMMKNMEIHWGIDLNNDGKVGNVRVAMLLVILFASIAGAVSVWDIGNTATSSGAGIGVCKVTSDGTSATLTVDKIVSDSGATSKGRAVVTSASTTDNMIQGYVCNSAAQLNATIITQVFSAVYTTAPVVVWSGAGSTNQQLTATVTTNQVTIGTLGATNATLSLIVYGLKSN
jgi:hypothetical protein